MGWCKPIRHVRAGGPPPTDSIEFAPEEIRRDAVDSFAKTAALYVVVLFLAILGFSVLAGVFQ